MHTLELELGAVYRLPSGRSARLLQIRGAVAGLVYTTPSGIDYATSDGQVTFTLAFLREHATPVSGAVGA